MAARRQEHSSAQLTAMVAAAAERIGASEGLKGITVRRLATAVGYAPNSLYHAIGDINAVILRLNARTLDRLHRSLKRRLKEGPSSEKAVMAVVEGYMAFVRAHHRLWSILTEYDFGERRPFPDWYEAALGRIFDLVDAVLAPFIADPADRRRSVAVLWGALHGIASLSLSGRLGLVTEDDALPLARLVVRRYLAGLAAA